jgi:hypothetical protein
MVIQIVTRPPLALASLAQLLQLLPFLLPQRPLCQGGTLGLPRLPSVDLALQKG